MNGPVTGQPLIGVAVLLWQDDRLLLGQRINTHGDGTWQFPGGRMEPGETVTACAARELREETGLEAGNLTHAGYCNQPCKAGRHHYITLFVSAEYISGEAEIMEPDKCRCWQWFHYERLPSPLFEPITNLLQQVSDLKALRTGSGIPAGGHK